jgi:hypothetical protein
MTEIKLQINDKEIRLNEIMSTVLTNINMGFINALNDIPEEKKKLTLEISF